MKRDGTQQAGDDLSTWFIVHGARAHELEISCEVIVHSTRGEDLLQ